jgi:GDP-L-fucose synthase
MKVLVTGSTGLLGQTIQKLEHNFDFSFCYAPPSSECDLTDFFAAKDLIEYHKPTHVVHLASIVGGIQDNVNRPFDFSIDNILMNANIIDICVEENIPLLAASSTCVYPAEVENYPLTEDMVDSGPPENTNSAYAYAKRAMTHSLRAAKKQYDYDFTVLYFSNLYGEFDHFYNENKAHLVTALVKKFHQAKEENKNKVILLGTGKPLRQFMYADDAANIIYNVIKKRCYGEYNVATPENLSVAEIAKVVAEIVGYTGIIEYNGKLDGVFRKDASSDRLLNVIGNYEFTKLKDGVDKTYKAFMETHNVEINE